MPNNVVEIILKGTDLTGPAFSSSIRRMQQLGTAASSMFAVFAGGAAVGAVGSLAALTARSIEAADEMGKLAQKAGLPVEQFSQLAHAAGLADVSTEQLQKAFKGLSDEMVKQGRGSESLLDQLLAQADVFASMEDGAEKTTMAVQLFGKAGQDLIPLLNQGSAAIREQMEEADRLGKTISEDFAKQADEFGDNLDKIKASFMAMGNTLAQSLLPRLLELQTYFLDTGDNVGKTRTAVDDLTASLVMLNEAQKAFDAKKFFGALAAGPMSTMAELIRLRDKAVAGTAEGLAGEMDRDTATTTKPPFPSLTVTPLATKATQESIDALNKWESAHADALMRALQLEDQFNMQKLLFSDAERARIDADYEHNLRRIADLRLEEDRSIELSNQAWEAYHANLRRLQAETYARNFDVASRGFGALASLSAAFGAKQFRLTQGLRIGEAIMHGAAGIVRVWADPGWPAAIALTAIIAAETAAQVATISAQKPPAAHGGLDFVPAEQTYLLDRGERVLSPRQNEDFTEAMEGGWGGGTVIHLHVGAEVLGTWFYDRTRDGTIQIHERAVVAA